MEEILIRAYLAELIIVSLYMLYQERFIHSWIIDFIHIFLFNFVKSIFIIMFILLILFIVFGSN